MKKSKFILSDFICLECANIIRLPRPIYKEREKYHLKKIWCYKCKKQINHIELHNSDIILKEIEYKDKKSEVEENVYQLVKRNKENI